MKDFVDKGPGGRPSPVKVERVGDYVILTVGRLRLMYRAHWMMLRGQGGAALLSTRACQCCGGG